MSTSSQWQDFDTVRDNIAYNTVEQLKAMIIRLNSECYAGLPRTGRKQDLIARLRAQADEYKRRGNVEQWRKAKEILNPPNPWAHRTSTYSRSPVSSVAAASTSALPPKPAVTMNGTATYATTNPYTSSHHGHPGSKPIAGLPQRMGGTSASAARPRCDIRFTLSPFFRPIHNITELYACAEQRDATERCSKYGSFTLSDDDRAKLASPNPKYQLRLYCTSSTFYNPTSHSINMSPACPIEFPPTCEVRVNGVPITAILRGVKKRPGTAPPANLGPNVHMSKQNTFEMIYLNNSTPFVFKKFFMVVMLVEVSSPELLVEKLKKGKYRHPDDIMQSMTKLSLADDDIVSGPQKMSLKCPLSYTRIKVPCRSASCVHAQCFDAYSWYSVMEQTSTWLCPVCEHTLNVEELFVDGYFDTILKSTPESAEDVVVESNGEWHTTDGKYHSAGWKPALPPPPPPPKDAPLSPPKTVSPTSGSRRSPPKNGHSYASQSEVVVLDSDEEADEGKVKRELSMLGHSMGSDDFEQGQGPRGHKGKEKAKAAPVVIDLTLDSDEEDGDEDVPLALMQNGKRRVEYPAYARDEYAGGTAKRARPEEVGTTVGMNGSGTGVGRGGGGQQYVDAGQAYYGSVRSPSMTHPAHPGYSYQLPLPHPHAARAPPPPNHYSYTHNPHPNPSYPDSYSTRR
ncbi:hypothetical protein BOTBODRAFT_34012 [Botryobasidium botryosum FD-172 SS1]|uniref:SP-RING-type domain-containing protein n=1 Tax=Botryobasidium botryosum (strain FD-172 SS1) TaxID=930990 RepID=A0A067MDV7_BOTB1|nr:hypothetical protein BOTBODRAFT_34012 [Botryobasidium botryosum FD-172 SS1]